VKVATFPEIEVKPAAGGFPESLVPILCARAYRYDAYVDLFEVSDAIEPGQTHG
jgi:hypothetical protein